MPKNNDGVVEVFAFDSVDNLLKVLFDRQKKWKYTLQQKIVFDSLENDKDPDFLKKLNNYIENYLVPTLKIGVQGRRITNRFSKESINIKEPMHVALIDRLFEIERIIQTEFNPILENDFNLIRYYFKCMPNDIYMTLID